jgi:hypothetical protein
VVLTALAAVATGAWVWFALQAHLRPPWMRIAQGLTAVAVAALLWGAWQGRPVGWVVAIAILACAAWYLSRVPRSDRDWIAETRHGATATFSPVITLHNVRRFRWTGKRAWEEHWEDWVVDPGAITDVEMILSHWGSEKIAHTMASFGLGDGRRIVFSGETRRTVTDRFSITGGFFRRFEFVLLATDERDAIHLRSEVRGERVYRYPVQSTPEARSELFLEYLLLGNDLARRPQWYNTITANCTTVPYRLVRRVAPWVGWDWRILLSGFLHLYLDRLEVLPGGAGRERAVVPVTGDDGTDLLAYQRAIRAEPGA